MCSSESNSLQYTVRIFWMIMRLFLFSFIFIFINHGCVAQQEESPSPTEPVTICTIDLPPMSRCPRGATNDSEAFTGISIDVFRSIAIDAKGWTQGSGYRFVCLPNTTTDEAIEYTLSPLGICDALIAATTITEDRISRGIVWSYPYLASRLSVIIKSSSSNQDGWNWTLPFTWQLWLALGVSIPILAAIIVLYEFFAHQKSPDLNYMADGWLHGVYKFGMLFVSGESFEISGLATKLVMLCAAFLALIVNASYTANLASYLTLKGNSEIQSIYDLLGKAVSAPDLYVDDLEQQYGLYPVPVPVRKMEDLKNKVNMVAQGKIAAFIVDKEIADSLVSSYPECAVRVLPGGYLTFNYGLAFDPRKEAELADDFTLSILKQTESGDISSIVDKYTQDESACLQDSNLSSELDKISFMQIYGLWVILAAAIIVGLVYIIVIRQYNTKKKIWERNRGDQMDLARQKSEVLP